MCANFSAKVRLHVCLHAWPARMPINTGMGGYCGAGLGSLKQHPHEPRARSTARNHLQVVFSSCLLFNNFLTVADRRLAARRAREQQERLQVRKRLSTRFHAAARAVLRWHAWPGAGRGWQHVARVCRCWHAHASQDTAPMHPYVRACAPGHTPHAQMVADLRQSLQRKDAFLSLVGHELRTPLNGVIGLSEALRRGAGEACMFRVLPRARCQQHENVQLLGIQLLTTCVHRGFQGASVAAQVADSVAAQVADGVAAQVADGVTMYCHIRVCAPQGGS